MTEKKTPSILRRDFMNGVLITAGMTRVPGMAFGASAEAAPYPPALTGLRGSHPGAFEAAHALRDHHVSITNADDVDEVYDLVVVGGGLSGLSAAHFFRKYAGADKSVLILDNHDDFGGHAKRNEFTVDEHKLVLNGGTLEMESPSRYNEWARMVLNDIGVDIEKYRKENKASKGVYDRQGLREGFFFDRAVWSQDQLVPASTHPKGAAWECLSADMLAATPLSPAARADLERIMSASQPDYLAGKDLDEKRKILATTSYTDFLLKMAKVDPTVAKMFSQAGSGVFCVGADALPALFAFPMGYPGFSGLGLGKLPEGLLSDLPGGQHGRQTETGEDVHFPDGNATLARLLVAHLVPGATSARTQEEMATATIDYSRLDRAGNSVRIRLGSMVLNVRHDGTPEAASQVFVTYTAAGNPAPKTFRRVRARQVVMACWNMFIPYLMPELPAPQKEALAYGVKGPIVYTNVALRNWHAFKKLGVSAVLCPTMFFSEMELEEPVSCGGLQPPSDPDQPIVLRMIKTMGVPGLSKRDQHRAGRAELLALSFDQFEKEIRDQLTRVLGPGGFDADRDIAAITVNRWPHGYAYTYNSLYDPLEWVFTETDKRPCVAARQPFGLVSIANSDAAASPHTDAAMLEAHRAVVEVVDRMTWPGTR